MCASPKQFSSDFSNQKNQVWRQIRIQSETKPQPILNNVHYQCINLVKILPSSVPKIKENSVFYPGFWAR